MPKFIPVDHDPFPGIEFAPADHDPFAGPGSTLQPPDAATSDKDQQISYNKLDCVGAYYACLLLRGTFAEPKSAAKPRRSAKVGQRPYLRRASLEDRIEDQDRRSLRPHC